MPPHVAYWLSSFQPDMEAVAAEVAVLRRAFPGSIAWGVSGRDGWSVSWRRGFGIPPAGHLLFRGATWLLQRAFDINHIFGGLGDWYHLRAVRKRPVVMTVALSGQPSDLGLLQKVDQFVVEWPGAREQLLGLGVPAGAIRLIFPPVDLERFRPAPQPDGPFTVLFASSPDRADWLEARGVPLLLRAAAACPEMRFRLIWRPWGDSLAAVRAMIGQQQLENVELIVGRFGDMAAHYRAAHVTVFPFTSADRCKPAPNSLLESLACARPVVVTHVVGLGPVVAGNKTGLVIAPTADVLVDSLRRLRQAWHCFSQHASSFARSCLGTERFLEAYGQLYSQLA